MTLYQQISPNLFDQDKYNNNKGISVNFYQRSALRYNEQGTMSKTQVLEAIEQERQTMFGDQGVAKISELIDSNVTMQTITVIVGFIMIVPSIILNVAILQKSGLISSSDEAPTCIFGCWPVLCITFLTMQYTNMSSTGTIITQLDGVMGSVESSFRDINKCIGELDQVNTKAIWDSLV